MKANAILFKAFFEVIVSIKLYHYQVISGFRHSRCDWMFKNFLGHSDRFLETMQGHSKYGRISVKNDMNLHITTLTDSNIQDYFQDFALFLTDVVPKMIDNDVELLNVRDELLADVNQFKYLMTFT